MVKLFKNNKIWKKIAIILVSIMLFQFLLGSSSQAVDLEKTKMSDGVTTESIGGKLIAPVCSLIVALGDGAMNIMQDAIMGVKAGTIQQIDTATGWWEKAIAIVVGVLVGIVIAALVIATGGAAAAALPACVAFLAQGIVGAAVALGVGAGAVVRI